MRGPNNSEVKNSPKAMRLIFSKSSRTETVNWKGKKTSSKRLNLVKTRKKRKMRMRETTRRKSLRKGARKTRKTRKTTRTLTAMLLPCRRRRESSQSMPVFCLSRFRRPLVC